MKLVDFVRDVDLSDSTERSIGSRKLQSVSLLVMCAVSAEVEGIMVPIASAPLVILCDNAVDADKLEAAA